MLDPQGDGKYDLECRLILPDGSLHWFITKGQAFFEGEGAERHPVRFIGTVLDITDHKRAEAAIQQAEERFRSVATLAPVGIFQTNRDGHCLFVNEAWCEIVGSSFAEALGDGWQRFLHPADRRRVIAEWRHATANKLNQSTEFRFLNPQTGVRSVVASAAIMLDCSGQLNGYVGSVVDVTDRKAAEDAVRASEARLQGILGNSPALIYLKDLQGRFLLINRCCEEMWNTTSEQIRGQLPESLFPAEVVAVWRANDSVVIASGHAVQVEESVPLDDGTQTFLTAKFPIYDASGAMVAIGAISTDVSEQTRAREALEAEQEMLRHTIGLQENERQLISCEIHDGLVQYAAGSLMQLESLQNHLANHPLAEQLASVVANLRKVVAEGRRLINGIRTPVLDDLGVIPAIEQLIDEEERAHVQIEFVRDEGLGRMPRGIEEALYRITQEALTNVQKHSQSEKVRVELERHGGRVRLAIRDWGIGFMPANGRRGGHGLKGMAERAKIAGGLCQIESAPGKGTQVLIDLPCESAS